MAAFAMFAILFGLVLQILSTSLSNTRRSGDYTQAALIAQTKIDMVGIEEIIEPGRTEGRYNDRFSWTMDIEPYLIFDERGVDFEELPIDLHRITLTVYWGDGHNERSATFETLKSVDRFWADRQADQRLIAN